MACCYPDSCGEYAVTPCLVSPAYSRRCCEVQPLCYPCLPCTPKTVYCCEKKSPKPSRKPEKSRHHEEDCCEPRYCRERSPPRHCRPRSRSPPPPRRCGRHEDCHEPCCYPTCKPVKTQYVIPCYRYEDGRINQPTVLMRRACEVAVGSRTRRKPFVEESYCADEFKEVRRYASEDERGNCCFHYEKKNTCSDTDCCAAPYCHHCNSCHDPCLPCPGACKPRCQRCCPYTVSSPQCCPSTVSSPPCCKYMDCVAAGAITKDGSCCYYC